MRSFRYFLPLTITIVLACGASDTAQAQHCGGLHQQACKASEAARACTGRLVSIEGRCRIPPTVPRKDTRPPLEPHTSIEKPPPVRPQLCDPSALLQKGGRC